MSFSAREAGIEYPVGTVRTAMTPEIPDPARKLATGELVDWIRQTQPGTFSLDRRFLPGLSDEAQTAQFIEIKDHAKTRENSFAHEVRFGQLLLNAADDAEQSLYVAIKPFITPRQAAHEYAVASYFSSGGVPEISTFRPFGVYRLNDGKNEYGVISNYRHSVRSLDNTFWNPEAIKDSSIVAKAFGRAALTLGNLHTNNWTHGDAQVKNIAWDISRPVESTFLVDVEHAKPFPRRDPIAAAKSVRDDIEWFLKTAFYLKDLPDDYEELAKRDFCIGYVGMTAVYGKAVLKIPSIFPDYDELVRIMEEQRDLQRAKHATSTQS